MTSPISTNHLENGSIMRYFIHTNGTTATLTAKDNYWMVRGWSWTVPVDTEAEGVAFLAGSGFREYDASDARAALKAYL